MSINRKIQKLARQTGRQTVITEIRNATMEDREYSRDEIWAMLNEISADVSDELEEFRKVA
ncbi:MAG: hypothetical protein V3V05_10955 [Pontiella sp.]